MKKKLRIKTLIVMLLMAFTSAICLTACGTLSYDDYYNIGYTAGSYLSHQ